MINAVYQLVAPRLIDVTYKEINLDGGHVIIRPVYMAICNADQRYYQGMRAPNIMHQKLPMALIHECVARVVYDPTGTFKPGDMVIPIPNTPTLVDEVIGENYLRTSRFRSSGFDGFMQDYVDMMPDRLVKIPKKFNMQIMSFAEIVSVSMHAVTRFEAIAHQRREVIGVWGDGVLGYITSAILRQKYPDAELVLFGTVEEKRNYFSFMDATYNVDHVPEGVRIDHAFECVGGHSSQSAINQIIDVINPEGKISIMGVSENNVAINTRMILEKGLRMFGSSRSGRKDFENTIDMFRQNPQTQEYFENLIGSVVPVKTIPDIHKAFDIDINKGFGKTILRWEK